MVKIDLEEGELIEFEEKVSQNQFCKKVVGMANTKGGDLYLGVRDDKEVVGINITNHLKEQIQDRCNHCKEPITVKFDAKKIEAADTLIVKIPKGLFLPHTTPDGKIFIRTGAVTRLATPKEIQELVKSSGYVKFESLPVRDASLDDFDNGKINDFKQRLSDETKEKIKKISDNDFLMNIGAIVKDNGNLIPTTTGLLFFAGSPQKFVSHSRIEAVRFKGIIPVEVIDRSLISGSLIELIEESIKFTRRNTRNAMKITGTQRIDIPEYPITAIREGIVNAIAHREYITDNSPAQLYIFDDRIEITNPGIPGTPVNRLIGIHKPRNENICKLLSMTRYVEGLGTGIARMNEQMINHGLQPPVIDYREISFCITFHSPKEDMMKLVKPIATDLKDEGLNDRQIKALAYIQEHKIITHREYHSMFDVNHFQAMQELKKLVDKEYIRQTGKGKDSRYELME